MYKNLEAEMVRKGITRKDIAHLLKVRYATVSWKLSGKSRLYYDEALKIKNTFFPEFTIEYLFETKPCKNTA
jgi:predicted transcriptional regulator